MTNYIKYEVKVYTNGDKAWYLNGELHREDGPAIEYANGDKHWFLNGESLTKEEHKEAMTPTVEMTMAQINEALGKNVKVVE
jgi:N-acetylneuraminic acid mutarotase